jgi:hypothetical protein
MGRWSSEAQVGAYGVCAWADKPANPAASSHQLSEDDNDTRDEKEDEELKLAPG